MKWLIFVFIIFFIIMCVILTILKKDTNSTPSLNVNEKEAGSNPAPSPANLEQIKMDIITGKRQDVPPEIGEDKALIIAEYLYKCYITENENEKIKCYELYYLTNDAEFKQQKEGCEKLSVAEKTKCLDQLYYDASDKKGYNLCVAIKDDKIRSGCFGIG